MNIPLLPFELFFALLTALTLFDAWSTYKAIKAGAAEANPVLRKLFKAFGVKYVLTVTKAGYLYLVWTQPPQAAWEQWLILAMYLAVSINNARALKKLGVI